MLTWSKLTVLCAVAVIAAVGAPATAGTVKCASDVRRDTSPGRLGCYKKIQRRDKIGFGFGSCGDPARFEATPVSTELSGFAYGKRVSPRKVVMYDNADNGGFGPLKVIAYIGSHRMTVRNYSRFNVEVYFELKC